MKLRIQGEPGLAGAGPGDARVQALCRTLQETVAAWLLKPLPALVDETGARSLVVSGGVACNSELRAQAKAVAADGWAWPWPSPSPGTAPTTAP